MQDELSGRIQELQNEINCLNDSKEFQDAESIRSGNSHITSRPVSFPPHPIPEGILRHSFVTQSRREGPPSIWDTHGLSGNVFVNPDASSSAPYPEELNQWNSWIEEPLHSSTVEKSERQEDQDLKCQSGRSAKKSVIFSGGDSSKNYGADQQRLQISDLHFDKFPTPATFACWKIRFKTGVCTCSQFPTEALQWIKEVEMVDSVDYLKSSSSIRGISMPNFEVLDARLASALNKIIHNSHFKRRISLEEQKAPKEDLFLRGRKIAHLIYEYFRVTGANDSVEKFADAKQRAATRVGWGLAVPPAVCTSKGGISAGVGIAARSAYGMTVHELGEIPECAEGRIAACHVGAVCKGGFHILSVYLWHSEGLTARNLDLLQTLAHVISRLRGPWLLAGDFNITPQELVASGWLQLVRGCCCAPQAPTCGKKMYDFFVTSSSLAGLIAGVSVVHNGRFHPHSPVRLWLMGKVRR